MLKRRQQSAPTAAPVVVAAAPKRPIAWSKITNFQLTALLRIAGVDGINNLRTRTALIQAIKSNNIPRPPADEIETFISANDNGGYNDVDGDDDGNDDVNNGDGDNGDDNNVDNGNNGSNSNDNDNGILSDGDDIPLAQRKRARVTQSTSRATITVPSLSSSPSAASQAATRSTRTRARTATPATTTTTTAAAVASQPTTLDSLATAIAKMSKGMNDLKHDVDSLHDVVALHVSATSGGNGNQPRGEGKGIANNPASSLIRAVNPSSTAINSLSSTTDVAREVNILRSDHDLSHLSTRVLKDAIAGKYLNIAELMKPSPWEASVNHGVDDADDVVDVIRAASVSRSKHVTPLRDINQWTEGYAVLTKLRTMCFPSTATDTNKHYETVREIMTLIGFDGAMMYDTAIRRTNAGTGQWAQRALNSRQLILTSAALGASQIATTTTASSSSLLVHASPTHVASAPPPISASSSLSTALVMTPCKRWNWSVCVGPCRYQHVCEHCYLNNPHNLVSIAAKLHHPQLVRRNYNGNNNYSAANNNVNTNNNNNSNSTSNTNNSTGNAARPSTTTPRSSQ